MIEGVVFRRIFCDTHNGGGFGERQILGVFTEIGLRRGLQPVAAVAQSNDVQICLQNLRLSVFLLQFESFENFLQLSVDAVSVLLRDILDKLLRNGGAAAVVFGKTKEHVGKGKCRALPVNAVMVPESLVLDCDCRVLGVLGHFIVIDPFAVFGAVHCLIFYHVLVAVIRVDRGGIIQLELREVDVAHAFVKKGQHINHRCRADNTAGNDHDQQYGGERLRDVSSGTEKYTDPFWLSGRAFVSSLRQESDACGRAGGLGSSHAGRGRRPRCTRLRFLFAVRAARKSVLHFFGNTVERILKSHIEYRLPNDIIFYGVISR